MMEILGMGIALAIVLILLASVLSSPSTSEAQHQPDVWDWATPNVVRPQIHRSTCLCEDCKLAYTKRIDKELADKYEAARRREFEAESRKIIEESYRERYGEVDTEQEPKMLYLLLANGKTVQVKKELVHEV